MTQTSGNNNHTFDTKIFSERFSTLCRAYRINDKEIARETDIRLDEITLWQTGQMMPNAYTLKLLAEIFNTTVDYLLGVPDAAVTSLAQKKCYRCIGFIDQKCEMSECHGCIMPQTALNYLSKESARTLYNEAFLGRDTVLSKET